MTKRTYIAKSQGYGLTANGELWKLGKHGYLAGHVLHVHADDIDTHIDAHEEEVRCLMAEASEEFGLQS
jgi:hypothetical protein